MFIKIIGILVACASVLTLPVNDASACGPDFPIALLSQRPTTMSQLPEGIFMTEVKHLVGPPAKQYLVTEGVEPAGARDGGSRAERVLYDQGAKAFHDPNAPATEAIQAFEALLKLPAKQRQYRSTWAAFMLGRLQQGKASVTSYQMVRTLVAAGFRDDLGLAAASLRQEAARYSVSGNRALELATYAELASHGSHRAGLALLFLVRKEIQSGAVTSLAADPVGQKLLGAYLYSRRNEMSDRQMNMALSALAQPKTLKGGARLAAAAYREGKWGMAQRFATQDGGDGLAKWVLAKLASRQGNHGRAKVLMGQVEKLLTPDKCNSNTRSRISAERTVLELQAGNSSKAMKHSQGSNTNTALYVAEQVLTVAELTSFVKNYSKKSDQGLRDSLMSLLARRLMRDGYKALEAGKTAQAERDFHAALDNFGYDDGRSAEVLSTSLLSAFSEPNSIERAKAFYQASAIARLQGLELLGTSLAPDWQIYGGNFDLSAHVFAEPHGKWFGTKEARRVKASAPMFSKRFHYRYLASHLAEKAADSLPQTSQAFAAVLCHATRYVYQVDRKRVRALWARYAKEGPAVPFSAQFGIECPEPDFIAAEQILSQKYKPIDLKTPLRSFGAWSRSKLSTLSRSKLSTPVQKSKK